MARRLPHLADGEIVLRPWSLDDAARPHRRLPRARHQLLVRPAVAVRLRPRDGLDRRGGGGLERGPRRAPRHRRRRDRPGRRRDRPSRGRPGRGLRPLPLLGARRATPCRRRAARPRAARRLGPRRPRPRTSRGHRRRGQHAAQGVAPGGRLSPRGRLSQLPPARRAPHRLARARPAHAVLERGPRLGRRHRPGRGRAASPSARRPPSCVCPTSRPCSRAPACACAPTARPTWRPLSWPIDEETVRWLTHVPWPYPEEAGRGFLAFAAGSWLGYQAHFAIADAASDALLGGLNVDIDVPHAVGEVGYRVNPEARGRGVATRGRRAGGRLGPRRARPGASRPGRRHAQPGVDAGGRAQRLSARGHPAWSRAPRRRAQRRRHLLAAAERPAAASPGRLRQGAPPARQHPQGSLPTSCARLPSARRAASRSSS